MEGQQRSIRCAPVASTASSASTAPRRFVFRGAENRCVGDGCNLLLKCPKVIPPCPVRMMDRLDAPLFFALQWAPFLFVCWFVGLLVCLFVCSSDFISMLVLFLLARSHSGPEWEEEREGDENNGGREGGE